MLPKIDTQMSEIERKLFDAEGQLAEQSAHLEDIAHMGMMITSLLDLEAVLAAMMEMAIRMVDGEVGSIMLVEDGKLQTRISWGLDSAAVNSIRRGEVSIAEWALTRGESVACDLRNRANRDQRIEAIAAVPVVSKEKKIGVLLVVNKASGEAFGADDVRRLEMLVRFAAVAIENASLMRERLERQKFEQELALAHQVQQTLLPAPSARFCRAAIEASYLPAGQVGGDYYDIIPLSDDEFIVIVGDVTNKGVPAALMMAATRSAFRLQAQRDLSPAELITDLNRFLCEHVLRAEAMFISLVFAHFDLKSGHCTYVNAGHLPPAHYKAATNTVVEWRIGGTVVGQFDDFVYQSETVALAGGDRILFYTDGVSECENQGSELYGRQRILSFMGGCRSLSPREIAQQLLADVERHRDGATKNIDDTTVLVVEVR